jgi:triosephosphate isomerase
MPASRVPLVAGNWKMNPVSRSGAVALALASQAAATDLPVRTVICPPAIFLEAVVDAVGAGSLETGRLGIGAQTMHELASGAFTGEVSAPMLAGLAQYVIVGHSERRQYFNETDASVAAKTAAAIEHGLVPITAVGERAEERRAGQTQAVIDRQLRAAISSLDRIAGSGLVIAYEPVWAIGTGDPATGADAQSAAAQIRAILHEADPDGADEVPILYGGSLTPDNAAEMFGQPDVDGALVGGASLDAARFAAIVRAAADAAG